MWQAISNKIQWAPGKKHPRENSGEDRVYRFCGQTQFVDWAWLLCLLLDNEDRLYPPPCQGRQKALDFLRRVVRERPASREAVEAIYKDFEGKKEA